MNNNDTIFDAMCTVISNVASKNYPVYFVLVSQIIVAPMAVYFNVLVSWLILKKNLFTFNLKLLLLHLHMMILWFCTGLAMKAAYDLYSFYWNPCELIITSFTCKIIEIPIFILPLYNVVYSLIIVVVEQLYTNWKLQSRHNSRLGSFLSVSLVCISWTLSLLPQVIPIFNMDHQAIMPVCLNLVTLNKKNLFSLIGIGITAETLAVTIGIFGYYWNKSKVNNLIINQAQYSLRGRFMLVQSMKITSGMIVPGTILHCAFYLPFLISLLSIGLSDTIDYGNRMVLINAAYLSAMIFGTLHPIVVMKKKINNFSQNVFVQLIIGRKKNRTASFPFYSIQSHNYDQNTIGHFSYLNSQWNKNHKKKRFSV